jgi:hypothetical protein
MMPIWQTSRRPTRGRKRLFWSGDRIEWLMSRGFHQWLIGEIDAGRAAFPG